MVVTHTHPTATHPLPLIHTTATHPLPLIHCHLSLTRIQLPLPHGHTATQPLPPNHCHPTTATQPLPPNHCHPATATATVFFQKCLLVIEGRPHRIRSCLFVRLFFNSNFSLFFFCFFFFFSVFLEITYRKTGFFLRSMGEKGVWASF
jgi:hypothetical protein